jgi:hypothetical protein
MGCDAICGTIPAVSCMPRNMYGTVSGSFVDYLFMKIQILVWCLFVLNMIT